MKKSKIQFIEHENFGRENRNESSVNAINFGSTSLGSKVAAQNGIVIYSVAPSDELISLTKQQQNDSHDWAGSFSRLILCHRCVMASKASKWNNNSKSLHSTDYVDGYKEMHGRV